MNYDKIIFLDFDGVLNYETSEVEPSPIHPYLRLEPKLAQLVQQICDRTNAVIVLSTSWRPRTKSPWRENSYLSLDDLRMALSLVGITAEIIDVTPDLTREDYIGKEDLTVWRSYPRHREISEWISNNKPKSFVILDDDINAEIAGHFVHTSFLTGITTKNVEKAVSILNGYGV